MSKKDPLKISDYVNGTQFRLLYLPKEFARKMGIYYSRKQYHRSSIHPALGLDREAAVSLRQFLKEEPFEERLSWWSTYFMDGTKKEYVFSDRSVFFDLKPTSHQEIELINIHFYEHSRYMIFQEGSAAMKGLDFDSRKANFETNSKKLNSIQMLNLIEQCIKQVYAEFSGSEFFITAGKIVKHLQSNPEIDMGYEIFTYGQTLVLVYSYETYLFLNFLTEKWLALKGVPQHTY